MRPTILAVCSGGGIGDLLAATPAMRAIARHLDAPITVLASPYAAPVLQDQPWVRDVFLDDGSETEAELAERLRARNFTHAIVFWSTARVAGAVRRAAIPVRVGQGRRLYSGSYTQRVIVRTEIGDRTTHWSDVQMDYARALGANATAEDFDIEIRLREADEAEAERVLAARKVPQRFAVFHAARGIDLNRVRWPHVQFAAVADAIAVSFDAHVVLTGTISDKPSIESIGACMRAPHTSVAGETSLMGLAAICDRAALVVALDSGPMHIAAALGVPTVGIFALRTDLPERWRPLGARVALVRSSYPCPPWHRKETCKSFACYANLAPADVVAAAQSIVPVRPASIAAQGK